MLLQDDLQTLINEAAEAVAKANNIDELEQLRIQLFGKKGRLTEVLKSLGSLTPEERSKMGQVANKAKEQLLGTIEQRKTRINQQQLAEQLQHEKIDVTLPGRGQSIGSLHPITQVRQRVEQLFTSMGFQVIEGPEIEDEYHNFEALNIPAHHPARTMMDTFYLSNGLLLRTHTSNAQIRVMKTTSPPLRMVSIGRVYRCDSDQTHTPMFHQLEGLVVDESCTFANLKEVLQDFFNQFFEKHLPMRFRPSYFPFTEPSAEVDIQCTQCQGKGCKICKNTGWLEVLGCGMVHPNVFQSVGIDSERYTGFAFGLGLDRLAMLRYEINDLRKFFENDLRFLGAT
jgi:phenylalanyl-tRNA synthetase alpha chain